MTGDCKCIDNLQGDGRKGVAEFAPYNAIHVGAAAPKIPEAVCCVLERVFQSVLSTLQLIEQLAPGGRMVIPVGAEYGSQASGNVECFVEKLCYRRSSSKSIRMRVAR